MKFAIIHNGLHDRHSHYYNEALGWIRMCRAHSIELRLYINKKAQPAVIADTGGIPAFPYASDVALLNVDPVISDIHGLVEVGSAFARALSQIELGMLDVLVVPFASEKEVLGVAQWLGSLPESARPRVVFIFHQGSHNWTLDDNSTTVRGNMSTYSYAAFRIRSVLPPWKIAFLATNPRLASVLSKVMGLPATVCPMPKNYVETDASEQTSPPHAHLALIGEYRAEKGQSLIPEIVSGFCRARPGRDVFIQVNAEKDLETFAKLELPNTQLHSYVGQFSHSAYSRRLETIDLMLLPYDERRYWFRFSGIFADALTFGIPTVVPARTRMAEVLQQGWGAGVEFAHQSVGSILEAVLAASDQINTLRAKAQSRRTEWRQSQCIEALFGMILKWTSGKD